VFISAAPVNKPNVTLNMGKETLAQSSDLPVVFYLHLKVSYWLAADS
jgi:hypothetical protein